MKIKIIAIVILITISISNSFAQRVNRSKFKAFDYDEMLAPILNMQQQHEAMSKNINNLVAYINDIKKKTDDKIFITSMDGYLTRLRNMHATLDARGINAVSAENLSQIYNEVQEEINKYNARIEQQTQVQSQLTYFIGEASKAMKNHRYSVAIENLTKAINLGSNNPDIKEHYKTRGICYLFGIDKPQEAVSDFMKYSQQCEQNSIEQAEAYFLIGLGHENSNSLTLAEIYYSNCIRIDNSFLEAYFRRGIVKSIMNKRQEAITDYNYIINYQGAAKQAFNQMATVYNNKAYCLIELGDFDTAFPLINKALEMDSSLSYIWETRGEYYYNKGQFKECIKDMDRAIELSDISENSFYYRGLAKIQIGKKTDGCIDLSKAQELGHFKADEALSKYCK